MANKRRSRQLERERLQTRDNQLNRSNNALYGNAAGSGGGGEGGGNPFGPGGIAGGYRDAQDKNNQLYQSILGDLDKYKTSGGYDEDQLKTLRERLAQLQTTGGYGPTNEGGYNPEQLAKLRESWGLNAVTGGYDPDAYNTIYGNLEKFSQTGGYSEADKVNFRSRATAPIQSIYKGLTNRANRQAILTGRTTGGDLARLGRDLSGQVGLVSTQAEGELQDQIRRNQMLGLQQFEGFQRGFSDAKRDALRSLGLLEGDVARGERDINADRARGIRDATGLGINLEGQIADNRLKISQNMSQLYDAGNQRITEMGRIILNLLGMQNDSENNSLRVLTELANQPGLFDRILQIAQAAGGVLTGIGGITGLGTVKPKPTVPAALSV